MRRILPASTVSLCGPVRSAASPVETNRAPVPGWKRTRQPSWNVLCGIPVTIGVQSAIGVGAAGSRVKRATRLSAVVE